MSTMPNQLEWYRRMKNENRRDWLWPRTLVMGEYKVLLTSGNECRCGSCQYGLLFWMVKGERTLGSVLKRLTQVSTQVALKCHLGRQLPVFRRLKVGQIQVEREIQHSSPAIPLSSSGTSSSSSSSILHWSVLSEWRPGSRSFFGVKSVPGTDMGGERMCHVLL